MEQIERNSNILKKYIPEPAVPIIAQWIYDFNFKLKIKRSRQTRFGDYRPPLPGMNHQITVNHDLNPYAFLLTLVHEIAHLITFERYGNRVKPHGEEWKESFKELMRIMIRIDIWPDDVREGIIAYMRNPGASSCSDDNLMRIFKNYDRPSDEVHLETLPLGAQFEYNERLFTKGPRIRKRYRCKENTGHVYLFSPLAEVIPVDTE